MFCSFNHAFELFQIFNICRRPIIFEVSATVSIPPTLGIFGDVDNLRVLSSYSFHSVDERLNDVFKEFAI